MGFESIFRKVRRIGEVHSESIEIGVQPREVPRAQLVCLLDVVVGVRPEQQAAHFLVAVARWPGRVLRALFLVEARSDFIPSQNGGQLENEHPAERCGEQARMAELIEKSQEI